MDVVDERRCPSLASPLLGSNMNRDLYRWLSRVGLIVAALTCHLASDNVARASDDPVEDLRRTLSVGGPIEDSTAEALEFRKSKIQESVDRMRTIGQLRRALVLDEWKVDPNRVVSDGIRAVDLEMRRMVGDRLKASLEKMASTGNANARLAVANLISEMGPTVRAVDPGERGGYCRSLEPLIAKLCVDPDIGVRQEALRALGNINGNPNQVAGVFRRALEKESEVGPRRLAADGLQQMIKVTTHLQKRGQTATGVEATRKDLLDVLQTVAPVAAVGVSDADSEVRMLSLQAVQTAAQALAELLEVPEGLGRQNFPPAGRRLSANERARILDAYKQTEESLALIKPMLDSFRKEVNAYAAGLRDPQPRVRLAAARAFENLANARLRLVRRANSLPTLRDLKGEVELSPAEMMKQAEFLEPFLDNDLPQVSALMRDPDVRIRRAAVEIYEMLERQAQPGLEALIAALRDPDRIVRWTSARTLGYLEPEKAVPAILPLADSLKDPDLNIRIAAANSLEALASVAKDAVPALAETIRGGDIEARLSAMYALIKIGPGPARAAVPSLIETLSSHDPRAVKVACETLAEIGPPAAQALPALRRLIGHEDGEVRAWASEAILSILRSQEL